MKVKTGNSNVYKKMRRARIAREYGSCSFCSPHDGENRWRRPREDRHKNKRDRTTTKRGIPTS